METFVIDGVTLHLAPAVRVQVEWIGQKEAIQQLLACWLDGEDPFDPPLVPRIVGLPGTGKTTLAMAGALQRGQSCWIQQCTADTRPEDLLVTPVVGPSQSILYHASPLLTAVLRGGCCVLDEGNRMSEKSWASLAGLLDHRRSVDSVVAGIRAEAHPDFRCCVTMNEDASTFELPDYIISRLQPSIALEPPSAEDELRIIARHAPRAPEEVLHACLGFLQRARAVRLPVGTRDGITLARLTGRFVRQTNLDSAEAFARALDRVFGNPSGSRTMPPAGSQDPGSDDDPENWEDSGGLR